ncbi:MAG: serine/threonine kinase PknH [Mycobacterium sp.]|nr:serine/threonine kinase PknH [Mycobacterium sp.]
MSVVKSPRIALGITALAGLTALGGVGVVLGNDGSAVDAAGASQMHITGVATTSSKSSSSTKSSSSSSSSEDESTSSSSSSSKPPTGGGSAKLISLLPPGFTASNCSDADQPVQGASATVDCGSNPNGPDAGRFALFSNKTALNQSFQQFASEDQLQPCPGMSDSPSQTSKGMIACGTYQNEPDLIWTDNGNLMLGDITGSSIQAIFSYWGSSTGG